MMHPSDDFLPANLSAMADAELAKGERLTWVGRPIPWRMARSSLPLALFGLPFTAFALFGMADANAFPIGGGGLGLVGIPFVLVGLGMLTSPVWIYRKALRTVYAITDRRAFTIEQGLWGGLTVRSFEPESLTILSRTQYADGSGHLVFQRELRERHDQRHGRTVSYVDVGFLAVPDVKGVEESLRELIERAGARRVD